jgi:hypothetical protein
VWSAVYKGYAHGSRLIGGGVPHSFRLAPDRGRDLPVADSVGLSTPDTDFDLTGSYRDDGYN